MATAIHRQVDACRAGTRPGVVARLASGWAVMGDSQFLAGYCLLLPDPVVPDLNALPLPQREQFLSDMSRLGGAVQAATGAVRINYAMFGNVEPALHAHVVPRFANEPESLRTAHPWMYDWSQAPVFDAAVHDTLLDAIRAQLLGGELQAEPATGLGELHHLDITVSSLARSTAFYDRWLPRMGLQRIEDCAEGPLWRGRRLEFGLQHARGLRANEPHDRYAIGLHHLAFEARSRTDIDRLFEELQREGVTVLDPPAQYDHYAPGYYAVFFADPDGIKLEYVHTP